MTNEAIQDAQKQDPGSALVILYELEYNSAGDKFYFSPSGYNESMGQVQFRDSTGTPQTYIPFPIEAEGFDISSDGSYNRPSVRIANLETTVKNTINNDFESLIGRRLIRRTTFQRYLVGQAGDNSPPVELPKQVYIIDRIKSKNILQVEFELSTPFDLAGIQLPRRIIVGGACPFKYKGAQSSINFHNRIGGCNWESKFRQTSDNVFLSRNDEYILPPTVSFNAFTGSATKGSYYVTVDTTPEGFYKVTSSGILQASNRTNYWQALTDNSNTPSDNDKSNWRRVWSYQTYSTSGQYDSYKDNRYNEYVLKDGVLWKVKLTQDANNHQTVQEGPYWTAGDVCGKTLASCRLRFYAKQQTSPSGGVEVSPNKSQVSLPFGGFPGAIQRR